MEHTVCVGWPIVGAASRARRRAAEQQRPMAESWSIGAGGGRGGRASLANWITAEELHLDIGCWDVAHRMLGCCIHLSNSGLCYPAKRGPVLVTPRKVATAAMLMYQGRLSTRLRVGRECGYNLCTVARIAIGFLEGASRVLRMSRNRDARTEAVNRAFLLPPIT